MRNTLPLLLLALLLPLPLSLTAQETAGGSVKVQPGFNFGFNSSLLIISDVTSTGEPVVDYQNAYRIGYFGSMFLRITAGGFFMQPELSLGRTQNASTLYLPPKSEETLMGVPANLECSIFSLDFPLLVGYNVIRKGGCTMGMMMGPRVRGILDYNSRLRNSASLLEDYDIVEKIHRLNLGLTLGVSVTIEKVYFDFRYDIGLHNINRMATACPTSQGSTSPSVSYHRRQNVLSFSVGAIF